MTRKIDSHVLGLLYGMFVGAMVATSLAEHFTLLAGWLFASGVMAFALGYDLHQHYFRPETDL